MITGNAHADWSMNELAEKKEPKEMDFHVFFTTLKDGKINNTGVNIKAYSIIEAVEIFEKQYGIEPIYCVNKGAI